MQHQIEVPNISTTNERVLASVSIFGLLGLFVGIGTDSALYGAICAVPVLIAGVVVLFKNIRRQIKVVIDTETNEITVHYGGWLKSTVKRFPLNKWKAVHSYITQESVENVVALRTNDTDFELLPLSYFAPIYSAASKRPGDITENPSAAKLRGFLAATGQFEDMGFSLIEIVGRDVT